MNVIANSMQFSASKKYDSSSLQIVVWNLLPIKNATLAPTEPRQHWKYIFLPELEQQYTIMTTKPDWLGELLDVW